MSNIKNIFLSGSIDLTLLCPKLRLTHLADNIQPYAREGKNGHLYLSLTVAPLKEPSRFGQTHICKCSAKHKESFIIGDFRDFSTPDEPKSGTEKPAPSTEERPYVIGDVSNLPF